MSVPGFEANQTKLQLKYISYDGKFLILYNGCITSPGVIIVIESPLFPLKLIELVTITKTSCSYYEVQGQPFDNDYELV